jgi:diguanylate cyclase (GGDEF)-like protein
VSLGIGEHSERHPGYLLSGLNDTPAELFGTLERGGDILDSDEEQDGVIAALKWADGGRERRVDPDINERVPRESAIRVAPSEQLAEELPGGVRIGGANLGVNNWMRHRDPFVDCLSPFGPPMTTTNRHRRNRHRRVSPSSMSRAGGGVVRGVRDGGDTWPVSALPARSIVPGVVVVLIALTTAGAVVLSGGGDAFWLCLPAALLVCASCRTRAGATLSVVVVVGAAAAPSAAWMDGRPLPSPLLVLFVVTASVAVLVAVRERLERERDTLHDFAHRDSLTSIANRRSLLARAEYEIVRHTRAGHSFALVMLDLDGFKLLNDRFGHAAGDDLLRDVAIGLDRAMRAQDTVARIGGDEFCVLAPETDKLGTHRLSLRIVQAVGDVTAGVETIQTSVGVAIFPDDGITASALLQTADQRLLGAKRVRQRDRVRRRAA